MNQSANAPVDQLLRLPEVLRRYPVSRTSWYEGVRMRLYPAPMRLGKRTVAWRESEIIAMIAKLNYA